MLHVHLTRSFFLKSHSIHQLRSTLRSWSILSSNFVFSWPILLVFSSFLLLYPFAGFRKNDGQFEDSAWRILRLLYVGQNLNHCSPFIIDFILLSRMFCLDRINSIIELVYRHHDAAVQARDQMNNFKAIVLFFFFRGALNDLQNCNAWRNSLNESWHSAPWCFFNRVTRIQIKPRRFSDGAPGVRGWGQVSCRSNFRHDLVVSSFC